MTKTKQPSKVAKPLVFSKADKFKTKALSAVMFVLTLHSSLKAVIKRRLDALDHKQAQIAKIAADEAVAAATMLASAYAEANKETQRQERIRTANSPTIKLDFMASGADLSDISISDAKAGRKIFDILRKPLNNQLLSSNAVIGNCFATLSVGTPMQVTVIRTINYDAVVDGRDRGYGVDVVVIMAAWQTGKMAFDNMYSMPTTKGLPIDHPLIANVTPADLAREYESLQASYGRYSEDFPVEEYCDRINDSASEYVGYSGAFKLIETTKMAMCSSKLDSHFMNYDANGITVTGELEFEGTPERKLLAEYTVKYPK